MRQGWPERAGGCRAADAAHRRHHRGRNPGIGSLEPSFIFVYGTLRRGSAAPARAVIERDCEWVGEGTVQGRLYDVGGYPGAVASSRAEERVHGEIYRIVGVEVLPLLDEYEECSARFPQPHEYRREMLRVHRPGGTPVDAWVYVYNRPVHERSRIKSGNYPAVDSRATGRDAKGRKQPSASVR